MRGVLPYEGRNRPRRRGGDRPHRAFLGMDEAAFIEQETELAPDRRRLMLHSRQDGSCAFLTADNLCRINPVKPDKCRTFPHDWVNPDSASVCPALASSAILQ